MMRNPAAAIRHLEACIVISTADCSGVLELGCGVGDKLAVCQGAFRVGVDAHMPYLQRARRRWGARLSQLYHREAVEYVEEALIEKQGSGQILWDAVLMIDFLEHVPRAEGRRLLCWCKDLARRRVVVYCPEGVQPQHHDSYSLGGEKWQEHRAAWWAEDLEKRGFEVVRWVDQHGPGRHALFAIWNQP